VLKECIYRQFINKGMNKQSVKINEPLRKHTSYKIGGPADFYCSPENMNELKFLILIALHEKIPYFLIGNGTNLLIRDKGIRGIVIKLGKDFKKVCIFDKILRVGAGINLTYLSKLAYRHNLSGLEFVCNIPGTLGGAIINNASFEGNSISNILKSITILDKGNEIKKIPRTDLHFNYRKCDLKERDTIIVEAELKLKHEKKEKIKSKMKENIKIRLDRQPLNYFSAGSIFKNPEGYFAGALIEQVGAKGLSRGFAEVSRIHGNFIVNKGDALASDVLYLIKEIKTRVQNRFGIKLEQEIEIFGEE